MPDPSLVKMLLHESIQWVGDMKNVLQIL